MIEEFEAADHGDIAIYGFSDCTNGELRCASRLTVFPRKSLLFFFFLQWLKGRRDELRHLGLPSRNEGFDA